MADASVSSGFKIGVGIVLALVVLFVVLPVAGCLACSVCAAVVSEPGTTTPGTPRRPSLLKSMTTRQTHGAVDRTFTGKGTNFTDTVQLYRGTARVEVEYTWGRRSENFFVYLKRANASGSLDSLLGQHLITNEMTTSINPSPPVKMRQMVQINTSAGHAFQVQGNGHWKIRVRQDATN